ncbi:hypothetical protein HRbin11_01287 [bacterium HR11]|nr:hypothetical protein HRbin11_01287 [bacterium HR11]
MVEKAPETAPDPPWLYLSAHLPTCPPTHLPICLPAYLPTCRPADLPICPSFWPVYDADPPALDAEPTLKKQADGLRIGLVLLLQDAGRQGLLGIVL